MRATNVASGSMAGHARARVLVADDNADLRAYVGRLLEPHCQVESVANGAAALEAIRARRPDLVLTDVMMPEMDGFALLRAIREDESLRDLPVMLLSARAGEEARVEGLAAGADDYLIKPFLARELIARVEGNLKLASVRRDAMVRLRRSEERQAFLLRLSDALRPLVDPVTIQEAASRLVGEHLGVERAAYTELEADAETMTVQRDWHRPGAPSTVGGSRIDEFGTFFAACLRVGQTAAIEDTASDPRIVPEVRTRSWDRIGARSAVASPIIKQGRLVAAFLVYHAGARRWTEREIMLLSQVAARTWEAVERARAERALARSEAKYRTLFEAMDEGFCIIEKCSGEPANFRWVEANRSFRTQTGMEDPRAQSMRETYPDAIPRAIEIYDEVLRTGAAKRLEFPMISVGRLLELHAFRIDGSASPRVAVLLPDITERKREEQHRELLIRELNHRVKNTLVTVQSLAEQSVRGASTLKEARDQFESRLLALAKTHDVLTREHWDGADVRDVAVGVLAPYRDAANVQRLRVDGPIVRLRPSAALGLSMALHELATNAVKYGALSNPEGQVVLEWSVIGDGDEASLHLCWREHGGPPVRRPSRRGFGSRLIERGLKHDLAATVRLRFERGGVVCTINTLLAEITRGRDFAMPSQDSGDSHGPDTTEGPPRPDRRGRGDGGDATGGSPGGTGV